MNKFNSGKNRFEQRGERKKFFDKTREKLKEKLSSKDASLVYGVRAIDDLDSAKSLLFQRLSEWTKTNYPEIALGDEEKFCLLWSEFGRKEEFFDSRLQEVLGSEKAEKIMSGVLESVGAEFDEQEKTAVQALAKRTLEVFRARKELQDFVEARARKILKNVCCLVEPLLAARLLSLCGGLHKLAEMPASTIQVIGAEKSLFKHLKTGSKPPKHGLLFQSPLINSAPLAQRGRIARALAAKIAIASKADYFTGNFIGEKLSADLNKRLKQIRGVE